LQDNSASEGCDVGDTGHVKEHVLGKQCCQAGEDLLRPPALALEIDNVRLEKNGASVAELRDAPRLKCSLSPES
jgi:hypothetical protein